MEWLREIVRDPARPELYLLLAIATLAAALGKLYRDQRRLNHELMEILRERSYGTNKLVSILLAVLAHDGAAVERAAHAARDASPDQRDGASATSRVPS